MPVRVIFLDNDPARAHGCDRVVVPENVASIIREKKSSFVLFRQEDGTLVVAIGPDANYDHSNVIKALEQYELLGGGWALLWHDEVIFCGQSEKFGKYDMKIMDTRAVIAELTQTFGRPAHCW